MCFSSLVRAIDVPIHDRRKRRLLEFVDESYRFRQRMHQEEQTSKTEAG